MRTILRALFFCIATWGGSTAQVLGQCSGTVYDPGGAGGNYPNNASWTVTYCPTNPGTAVTLTFTMFYVEAGYDYLYIYNGPNTSSPFMGVYSGTTIPPAATSNHTSGCLTLQFISDGSVNDAGWAATLSCNPLAPPPSICGTTVYDPGGPSGNYPNNANWTQTYCPDDPNEPVSLIFTMFQLENNWDYLYIYNGPTTASPLIGTYTGTASPGTVTSTDPSGCLTLRFTSDGSTTYPGWAAEVICGDLPPPPPLCGSTVYDPGGPSGDYPNYANWTQTYCPDNPGEILSLIFTMFQLENNWDYLYIYNGPNTSSPLLTTLTGSGGGAGCNTAYTSTHPSGCLTLRFTSDGSFTYEGWAAQVVCGTTPPSGSSSPPEDCNGGITVCSNQTFSNNTDWTGCTADLTGSNQGCLSSGERQGTWYFFSPNTAGTIGFALTPAAPTDYDFALWGPLTVVSCPPAGPPLRCSWSAITGPTGLGNGATDFSESAGGDGWVAPINVQAGEVYILYIDNWSTNQHDFSLNWNLSTPDMLDCTVLPMDLLHFTGELTAAGRVHLRWTTAHEHNTSHFVVERSTDGIAFDPVGEVQAAGHTVQTTDYETWDPTPRNGMNYYRLVQVDLDGRRAHANVVPILVEGLGARLTVVPNPAHEHAEVMLRELPTATRWLVTDARGRLLALGRMPTGANRFVLPLHTLTPGAYFVQVTDADGGLLETTRFMMR